MLRGDILNDTDKYITKAARVRLVCDLLRAAPAAADEHGALANLDQALRQIEDYHTDVPYDAANWMDDGRMYGPQDDQRIPTSDPDVCYYRTFKNRIYIGKNGAIKIIVAKNKNIILDIAGQDGKKVNLL